MTEKELERIEKRVCDLMAKCHDSRHDSNHLNRVVRNALEAVEILELKDKIDLNLLKATCLLHDIAYCHSDYHDGLFTYFKEKKIVKRLLPSILKKLNINSSEAEIILNACSKHSMSFPFKRLNKQGDYYTKILQDSDTLDLFYHDRVGQFQKEIKKIAFPRLILSFVKTVVNYGIRNIRQFLNYPQLYEILYTKKLCYNDQNFQYLETGENNKDTIVCLHGYADTAEIFLDFGKLMEEKFRIIAPNLPMISNGNQIYSIDSLEKFLSDFTKGLGLEKYWLFGFSLGSLVAIHHACKSSKVTQLILANCPSSYFTNRFQKIIYQIIKPLLTSKIFCFIYSLVKTNIILRNRLGVPKNQLTIMRMKSHYYSIFGTEFNLLNYDTRKNLEFLAITKIAFLFKDDEIIKFKRYQNTFQGLDCQVYYIENGGHHTKNSYWQNIVNILEKPST